MQRREILKYTALMTGAALSAPLILSLESCKTDPSSNAVNPKLEYFNNEQMQTVKSIIDTILPKTDSPAASDVGVHFTIDQMVGRVYNQEDKKSYTKNFAKFSEYLKRESNSNGFHNLTEEERLAILRKLAKSNNEQTQEAKDGYLAIKQQTIAYYLNTEEVATKFLNYLPVPGQYEGCITLESVGGKAWAI